MVQIWYNHSCVGRYIHLDSISGNIFDHWSILNGFHLLSNNSNKRKMSLKIKNLFRPCCKSRYNSSDRFLLNLQKMRPSENSTSFLYSNLFRLDATLTNWAFNTVKIKEKRQKIRLKSTNYLPFFVYGLRKRYFCRFCVWIRTLVFFN